MAASANATAATARKTISRRLLRRIISAKGPSDLDQKKKDAHERLGNLERWSGRATLIILAGIIVEIAYEFATPHSLKERIWITSADALIGIGLVIEYVCILRTIVASGEAQIESDRRVAELERETAEAKLQYEQLKAAASWRTIEWQSVPRLIEKLSECPSVVALEYVQNDNESQNFADQLCRAFHKANWKVHLRPRLRTVVDVWVLHNASQSEFNDRSFATVRAALESVGLPLEVGDAPAPADGIWETWGPFSPPVKVIVGSKPNPMLG